MATAVLIPRSPVGELVRLSLTTLMRNGTATLLAGLFVVLVMVSAYLGWSATTTVNAIYADTAIYLKAQGQPVPPNPVLEISPLSLMRNMSIYVSLIGALSAIVIGYQLIAADRKSDVVPLIGTRPVERGQYLMGKVSALVAANGALMGFAALVAVATFLILPQTSLGALGWAKLFGFFLLALAYMLFFGLIAMGTAATARSESVGLLVPVTVWLTVTFILPSLTANIHPTAAINPISALAAPPDTAFFHWTGMLIGPFSIAESFKYLAAGLLDYLPAGISPRSALPPLPDLALALILAAAFAARAVSNMDMTRGDYDA